MNFNASKIAIFSDLHLGVHQNSNFWHNIAIHWADWFTNELKKRRIDTIFFLGDFFHYRDEVAVNTLHVGYQILKQLSDFNIVLIPGNHDSFYKEHAGVNSINIFSGWKNLQIINEITTLNLCSKTATFVPWGGDILNVTQCDYLFGHFEINSFRMNGSKVCEKGRDPVIYLSKSRNIYSGHFHLRDIRKYNEGCISYVGNTFEMDFGDYNQKKGFHILDISSSNLEFIENTISPRHIKIPMSKLDEDPMLLTPERLKGNIVRVIVDQKINTDSVEKLITKINSNNPATSSVEYVTSSIPLVDGTLKECDMSTINIESALEEFIQLLDVEEKDKTRTTCIDIFKLCR